MVNVNAYQIILEKEARLIQNLIDEGVDKLTRDETPIDLILDNTTIHTANVSIKSMDILNITPR